MIEEPLSGGNATEVVVRVGATVRKPWRQSTAAVHEFLGAVRDQGIDAPRPMGRDDRGRQIVEYIEGTSAIDLPPLDLQELRRVGAMIRAIHDASPSFSGRHDTRRDQPLLPTTDADLTVTTILRRGI